MTRAQRIRHEKGLERAAAVMDKRQVKVVKSLGKQDNIKERAKQWEDVNGEGKKNKKKKTSSLEEADKDDTEAKSMGWVDVDDENMDENDAAQDGQVKGENKPVDTAVSEGIALPVVEDELL
jgi:protein required for attachment to host cells